MLSISDAYIDVFRPDNDTTTANFTVPADDIQRVDASVRAGQRKDSGTITLTNDNGTYTSGGKEIRSGDRLQVWTTLEDDIDAWGEPNLGGAVGGWGGEYGRIEWGGGGTPSKSWGSGAWGGRHDRWSCLVRDRTADLRSPSISDLQLKCEDFVFGLANKRLVFNHFDDTQISGTDDSIVDTIVDNEAPEIDKSRIETFTETTDANFDGVTLLDALKAMSDRADAVMRGRKKGLVLTDLSSISSSFDLSGTEIGRLTTKETDQGLANEVRVDGGTATDQDASQETQDTYTTVTNTSRATFRVDTRKSQIAEIEIWTKKTGSNDSVIVRLQKDDAGSPIAPDNRKSDIDSVTLSHEFLDDDGFTTFQFGEHTLPEPRPWVIIESDGTNGQDIGTDSNGNVTYKSKYPYNITTRDTNYASIQTYRKREHRIKAKSVQTFDEAREIVFEYLDHESVPEKTVEVPADSARTHRLTPLDVVTLDFPRELATGDYIVIERSDIFEGTTLDSTLTLQEVDSV